ncbi:6-phosphofructokinase [uncultured Clostridium sp.]|uniref:6-phosphofructokinase n=1 Tax=uncultured Clostridium sp. TaxID=59620 RepID=UPI00260ABE71|nr:6-phosphofructokinase [uncultured Clostridium sp.]
MNCLIAQSGGPTTVINASVYGVIKRNNKLNIYNTVFGGINGIEGILEEKLVNLSALDEERLEVLKNTPSSALGSCRYKLKDYLVDDSEYKKIVKILIKYEIETFFYIGGNDSMDTVSKLAEYMEKNNIEIKVIGIPKTIDNDLVQLDHAPGYPSAAKFIYNSVLETYLDSVVYGKNGVFILETMGRETGWLAIAAALAKIKGNLCVDLLYIPEIPFSKEKFLEDIKKVCEKKNSVYIVVAEGIKDKQGNFISAELAPFDKFGHKQLGGVGLALRNVILENGVANKVRVLELNTLQRAAIHCASKNDLSEASYVGAYALQHSKECKNGSMVGIRVASREPYRSEPYLLLAKEVANQTKFVPEGWLLENFKLSEEAHEYIKSLIKDEDLFYQRKFESFLV